MMMKKTSKKNVVKNRNSNEVNSAFGVWSQLVHADLEQIHEDDLEEVDLKWQLTLLSMKTRKFFQKTGRKITIIRSDKAGYDNTRRTINVEEISSKAMLVIDEAGFDWRFMADEEVPLDMALMAFSDSEPEFEGYGPKSSKSVSEDISNEVMKSLDASLVETLELGLVYLFKITVMSTMDLDAVTCLNCSEYNNFNIVEQEVKGTVGSSSQNLAFMPSTSSTNEVITAYGVSTANTQASTASTQVSTANLSDDTVYAFLAIQPNGSQLVCEDLEQIHEDDLVEMDLKWQLALLSMRIRNFFQKTGRNITINSSDTAGYDKSRNQDNSRRTINVEEISSKAMLANDGAGFDWSFMVDEEVPSDMAFMAFSESEKVINPEFNQATYKRGLASIEEQLLEKLKQDKESNQLKIKKFDNASKSLDKLIESQIPDKSRKGLGFVSYNAAPPHPTGLFSPLTIDLPNSGLEEFQQPEFEGYGPKISKCVSEDISNEVMKSPLPHWLRSWYQMIS
ncbi:hypothetical protein Tco_0686427 [Tanacetum coccineum]